MGDIERYKLIASKLSYKTEQERFQPTDVFDLGLENGDVVKIGPFLPINLEWETGYYWQENPDTDEYCIYLSEENWDSWGEMYSDFGTDFEIGEIVEYRPVIKKTYVNFPTPPRIRW